MNNLSIPCEDHLGHKYASISKMCKKWGVERTTYAERIKSGMSIKEALTTEATYVNNAKKCEDHLGNKYETLKDMCATYGISTSMYRSRINRGMSVRDALTKEKADRSIKSVDYKGNEFSSLKKMCESYKVSVGTYEYRIMHGKNEAEALTNLSSRA